MIQEKKFLTVTEAAAYLGVNSSSLRRWADDGKVTVYRFGFRGDRRFLTVDLDAYLEQARTNYNS